MEEGKITVRTPKDLIRKFKATLTLKGTNITKWLHQKIQEEINKQD